MPPSQPPASPCPQCGATFPDGGSCQERFDEALALEFTDARYAVVHHLTVAAYMLQHDRYTDAGWLATRELLAEFVDRGLSPDEARRRWQAASTAAGSVTRGARFARFREIRWTRTIADLRTDDPDAYRQDVANWAASVVRDSASVGDTP